MPLCRNYNEVSVQRVCLYFYHNIHNLFQFFLFCYQGGKGRRQVSHPIHPCTLNLPLNCKSNLTKEGDLSWNVCKIIIFTYNSCLVSACQASPVGISEVTADADSESTKGNDKSINLVFMPLTWPQHLDLYSLSLVSNVRTEIGNYYLYCVVPENIHAHPKEG